MQALTGPSRMQNPLPLRNIQSRHTVTLQVDPIISFRKTVLNPHLASIIKKRCPINQLNIDVSLRRIIPFGKFLEVAGSLNRCDRMLDKPEIFTHGILRKRLRLDRRCQQNRTKPNQQWKSKSVHTYPDETISFLTPQSCFHIPHLRDGSSSALLGKSLSNAASLGKGFAQSRWPS